MKKKTKIPLCRNSSKIQ